MPNPYLLLAARAPNDIFLYVKKCFLPLLFCFTLFFSPGCGKKLDKQIREQVRTAGGANLEKGRIEILEVTEYESHAIAEIQITTSIKMKKAGDDWVLEEVRLGDRRWERVDRIIAVLNGRRADAARSDLQAISEGLDLYLQEHGSVPQLQDFRNLMDLLAPRYAPSVIRIDPWWNDYYYRPIDLQAYELRSLGPDGVLNTEDDVIYE